MTYLKCTCISVKLASAIFWLAGLIATLLFVPVYAIPLSVTALFHFTYLSLRPVPVPIVLSFMLVISLSLYVVFMNTPVA